MLLEMMDTRPTRPHGFVPARGCLRLACSLAVVAAWGTVGTARDTWPAWRGPAANGTAAADQAFATEWSESENIVWKAAIPGRGHSSPTVLDDRVVVTTADVATQTQMVVCFDRETGRQLWLERVSQGGLPAQIHANNTHATPTVAFDGKLLFAVFQHHDGVHLTALDPDGKVVWKVEAGPYTPKAYRFGYAPSPVVYKGTVIVASEFDGESFIKAFDADRGGLRWHAPRPVNVSYSSPIVAHVAGRDQLLISGADAVTSYDPADGTKLWEARGIAAATCGTAVWDGDTVFASGGYPKSETVAVKADGSGRVVWRNGQKCYEQSMLAHRGHLYAVTDAGIAFCWDALTGAETWKSRLCTKCSSSPILAGDAIYITTEKGETKVFRADPEACEVIATNRLGDEMFATPAFCGGRIYARAAHALDGERREFLYCIGR
ncbi:MAG: PQQ-binding-like beta-propeller repeat protein [Planctomycetia bacterium]